MAGKHSQNKNGKKSKAPVIIIIASSVIVAAAVTAGIIFFVNGGFKKADTNATTAPVTTAAATQSTTAQSTQQATTVAADHIPDDNKHETEAQSSNSVVVPTQAEGKITYFNATYIPNGNVLDTFTGAKTSLREVFGSGYNTNGVITFNEDGSFSDSVSSAQPKKGAYVVQNEEISATYDDDRNMEITVLKWDGSTPSSFCISYAGYNVYFGDTDE